MAVFRDVVEKHQQPDRGRSRAQGGQPRVHVPANASAAEDDPGELDVALGQEQIQELRQQQQQQLQQQPSVGREAPASMELYNHLIKLTQMRSHPDVSVAALFRFFETSMYPLMLDASRELPNIFRQAAQQLVREVSAAKQSDYRAADLPTAARITQIRRQLDLLCMPEQWAPLVLGLAAAIAQSAGRSTDSTETTALVEDLVQTWRMFSLPDLVLADPAALRNTPATEFRMPTPDTAHVARYARRRNIQLGLACLFPRYAPPQMRSLSPALLATYAILTDPAFAPPAVQEQAHEFLHAVTGILSVVSVSRQAAASMFESWPELGAYVLGRWPLVAGNQADGKTPAAAAATSAQPPSTLAGARATTSRAARRATLASIHRQLLEALRERNLQACEAAWDRFWAAVSVPDVEGTARLQNSAEIFDNFILAFTTMRMPHRAVAVWSMMTMAGVQPTLRTWTSFMVGYKRTSNPAGIHSIWEKLVALGIQMDTAVWTARISGLIESGDAEAGMQALEEMQRLWDTAQTAAKDNDAETSAGSTGTTPVKPTIEPVNAAIAGLLRRSDLAAAKKVLAWAGRHGIEPDIITFNTILRPLVRDGSGDEVTGVLDMMRSRGIAADEATVTILLDGTFGHGAMAGRSAAQQADAVKQMLAEVEAAGLSANQQTYAKIVYLLLADGGDGRPNQGDAADAVVGVVLDRMRLRGLPLSSHICTILAENYFARSPPDIAAVRRLIENGRPVPASAAASAAVVPAAPPMFDRVFWERVVRGFAQVGDTASAQEYFVHIADSLSVTSSTLEDLLRALIRNNEWDAAAELVAKVQAQKTLNIDGGTAPLVDARQFRHRFWHLAAKHGLLQEQGASRPLS